MTVEDRSLVLVVDDSAEARAFAATYLRLAGFAVIEAVDGLEAVRLATEVSPTIILMDLNMPRLDGCGATARLRANRSTAGIPVLALTAETEAPILAQARAAGCAAVLQKSEPMDRLLQAILALAGRPS